MKNPWWKERVFYQIYPRSFQDSNGDGIGDIPGLISRLDYLQWLGIGAVWLCPVYDSPNDDMGYDIRDYRKIMSEFGTMEDFDRLLEEMHRRHSAAAPYARRARPTWDRPCFRRCGRTRNALGKRTRSLPWEPPSLVSGCCAAHLRPQAARCAQYNARTRCLALSAEDCPRACGKG